MKRATGVRVRGRRRQGACLIEIDGGEVVIAEWQSRR